MRQIDAIIVSAALERAWLRVCRSLRCAGANRGYPLLAIDAACVAGGDDLGGALFDKCLGSLTAGPAWCPQRDPYYGLAFSFTTGAFTHIGHFMASFFAPSPITCSCIMSLCIACM